MSSDSADENEVESGDWEVPTGHTKQIGLKVRPDEEYPVVLTVSHKEDALATKAGLTFEQVAMIREYFDDLLSELDNAPKARLRTVEPDETVDRGIR